MTSQILKIHKLVEYIDSELQNVVMMCTINLYLCTLRLFVFEVYIDKG